MSRLRLSICVPTYNFGAFIGATLDSIVGQATDEVEIVVVDGASTDDTAQVVQKIGQVFPRLRYYRREINGGVDADLAEAVDLARADYCWLMSADDVLVPHAVERILGELKEVYDVYLCNRTECDRDLTPITQKSWLAEECPDIVFRLLVQQDRVRSRSHTNYAEILARRRMPRYSLSICERRRVCAVFPKGALAWCPVQLYQFDNHPTRQMAGGEAR